MYNPLGVSEEITTCEISGQSNLPFTVIMQTAMGRLVHMSVETARKNMVGGIQRGLLGQVLTKHHLSQQERAAR